MLLPSFIVYVYFSLLPILHSLCTSFFVSIVIEFGRKREIGNSSVPNIHLHILPIDLFERNEKWGKHTIEPHCKWFHSNFRFFLTFFLFIVCFIGFLITFDTNRGEIEFCCLRIGQMICYNGLARRIGKFENVEIHHTPVNTNLVNDFEIQIIIGFFDLQFAPYRLRIDTKFGGGCADLIRCFSWRLFA